MAWTVKYATFGQTTGLNDGTSLANAWQTPADMFNNAVGGERVEMRQDPSTPYEHTTSLTITNHGVAASPRWFRGYASTPGDGGICAIEWTGAGAVDFRLVGDYTIWENLSVQPKSSSENLSQVSFGATESIHVNCHLAASSVVAAGKCLRSIYRCADVGASGAITISGTNTHSFAAHECAFILDNPDLASGGLLTNDGFGRHFSLTSSLVVNRTAATGVAGIINTRLDSGRGITIAGNIIHGFDDGIITDVEPNATPELGRIFGNLLTEIGGYAVLANATPLGYLTADGNWYHDCTSGFSNLGDFARGNVALSVSPYVDAAAGDFRINNTAGGGAVLRAAGGIIDPLGVEPFEADPFGQFYEPTGGGGGSPITRAWWG